MDRFPLSCILAALLIFAISPSLYAQDWARKMFKDFSHDFGTVAAGAKVQYAFEFSNPYVEDAHIQSVRVSCGCTKVDYPKDIIKTYEKSRVLATIDTLSFKGYKGATISVVFDKPFPAEVQLNVRTFIRQDVVFQPGEVQFGPVGKGEKASKKISIGYAGRSDWAIKNIKTPSKYIKTRLVEDVRAVGQVSYTLWVDLEPNAPVGYYDGQIILTTNDYDPKRAQVPLPVSGLVKPPLEVRPATLSLLGSPDGHEVVRNLVVEGLSPFKISSVPCDDPRISASHSEKRSKIHIIRVAFKPDSFVGKKSGTITINTDLPNEPPLKVKFITETIEANHDGTSEEKEEETEKSPWKPTPPPETEKNNLQPFGT